MASKPTILFVHGSWHTPAHYQRQLAALESAGFPTSCPLQPSVGKLPPIGLKEDAETIRTELRRLVADEGKEVIVVAHSYGGVVTTEAVDAPFGRAIRASSGKPGGVVQLLYVCAFVLPVGESLGSALGNPESLPDFIEVREDGMSMMREPGRRFYHDLPEEEQRKWVDELIWCPAAAQLTRISQTAYTAHPSTYLFCEDDQALPLEIQKMMIQNAENAGAVWKKETCPAGHSPFLGNPEHIVNVAEKIVTSMSET